MQDPEQTSPDEVIEFREGTGVYTADGAHVGSVERIVVEPVEKRVTHLVVAEGVLRSHDKVLPVELVEHIAPDRIELRPGVDVDRLADFEEAGSLPFESPERRGPWVLASSADGFRPVAIPTLGAVLLYAEPQPGSTRRSVPAGSVAFTTGTHVLASDERDLGRLDEVITDQDDRVTHLIVEKGLLRHTRRAIPVSWIVEDSESQIRLAVDSSVVEAVPAYHPGPPAAAGSGRSA